MARPLGGGGEVRGQGSSRAAAGDVRGGGGGAQVFSDATSEKEISPGGGYL